MNDPLKPFFMQGVQQTNFAATSRYYGTATATMETADGKKVVYLRRRLVPPQEKFELLQEHTVTEGERLDNLAQQYLGDPEQFWRLCDANGVLHPEEMTETVGRKLRITLPEGIPGLKND